MIELDRKYNLLLVDDEPLNRDMLARRLQKKGFSVDVAPGGPEALRQLEQQDYDAVLLDSMMPGMNGIEVLTILRATHSSADLPVIMVTAVTESAKVAEALSLGANDYVTKPVDLQVAEARIRSQLARKYTEKALRQSEERYALAARGANDGLWDWDLMTNRIYYSPRWKALLGYGEAEIGDDPEEWLSRIHTEDEQRVRKELADHLQGAATAQLECEHRVRHKNGSYRWMLGRGILVRDLNGKPKRMAGSLTDITAKSAFDPLTGLPNRILFNERLQAAIERAAGAPSFLYAVLLLDLDRFKIINDSLGHLAGDQLLVAVSERLRNSVRFGRSAGELDGNHIIARLGGDEFAVLLEELDSLVDAALAAKRIQRRLREPFLLDRRRVFCTVSIGIALSTTGYRDSVEVLRDADTAMYRAKARGRARCEIFDAEMRAKALARLALEEDLRRALENNELIVYYQPKVSLTTGRVVGFEALARWQDPVRGLRLPSEFIPLAEETGLIVPIGRLILREACQQMQRWHQCYPHRPLTISVNVSLNQFKQPGLVQEVTDILKETGLAPGTLQLELTESVLMEDTDAAIEILGQLRAMQVSLKIDDFGTGYSSLNYVHRLPVDTLKIDRSFVANMMDSSESNEIIKTIVAMAKNLHKELIAEGIESEEQAARLRSLGCDYGQGYYFASAMDALSAEAYFVERSVAEVT